MTAVAALLAVSGSAWGLIVAVGVSLVILLLLWNRRPKTDAGLDSWRRHIDALSPEARRGVIERVRAASDAAEQDDVVEPGIDDEPPQDDTPVNN